MTELTPRERLIFALDVPSADQALALVDLLDGVVGCFKIGLELFISAGPGLVSVIAARSEVFLDLKLHDIPATVGRAAAAAAGLGARYLTVHADPGGRALAAAVESAGESVDILAITVLTSHRPADFGFVADVDLAGLALERAVLAARVGCHGVVCSAQEAQLLRRHSGPGLEIITPGIRPAGSAQEDQSRVLTPREALAAGADRIVVGRPIRDALKPREAAAAIVAELAR